MKSIAPGVIGLLSLLSSMTAQGEEKPNILFIVADDLGYADVGFHGSKEIPTPNLDKLAAAGVIFTDGYVSAPYCSPSRAGLLTGRYQNRFGYEFNPKGNAGLPLAERTLADRLKAAGYVTGLVGKWHLGQLPEQHPQRRGFDEFFGFLGGARSYVKSEGVFRGNEPAGHIDYTTDAFGREAVDFINRHAAAPWFLYLAFNAVHTPMQATDDRLAKFPDITGRRKIYAAMTLALDDAVGRVMQALEAKGLSDKTLIAFISDNGGPTMEGVTVNASLNAPLRGSKRTTLEGGIRVPFVLSWPGHLQPGIYKKPVISLDLNATALAAAGVALPGQDQRDGVDLLPYLQETTKSLPHETLYWRFGQQMAIRDGDYKLVRYDPVADGQKKQDTDLTPRLYHLTDDIGESKDLAAAMPDKVKELQARWDAWNATLIAPRNGKASASDNEEEDAGSRKKKNRGD